jgi:acyl-CoA dehydrogenase
MHHGLADFAFAMQGLGSGAITLGGRAALRDAWLPRVASGEAIAAFALSEPDAGSDAGAMRMRATKTATGWRLDGVKTWISNGGIADFYCVFARSAQDSVGGRGVSGFFVTADTPGLSITERIDVISPHPLATLTFEGCEVPDDALLGVEGEGFALAMRTLDIFRVSVAAAATIRTSHAGGVALRRHARDVREQPWRRRSWDMATDVDSAALLASRRVA